MNRCLIFIFTVFNIALALYIWRYFTFLKEVKLIKESLSKSSSPGVFIPTSEWQPIGRDQPIPRNLHVRINLQTGEREARLLETEDDGSKNNMAIVPVESNNDADNESFHKNTKYELLKDSLNKISDDANKTDDRNSQNTQKFRTFEQLKEDMAQLNLIMKTEAEVILELIENFDKLSTSRCVIESQKENELLIILQNLEYLLHKVDNAEEFGKLNGFAKIIVPCLSSNSSDIQTNAARVLGSAVQNNAQVQITVFKTNVIVPLLKNVEVHNSHEVRSSSIFALSCLVRNFPLAELKLIEKDGLSVLLSIFQENSADSLKLQLKVLTFFNDLLLERDDAASTVEANQLQANITDETTKEEFNLMMEKLRQYNSVGLRAKLVERGWCSILTHFLTDRVFKKPREQATENTGDYMEVDHDAADKVLSALSTVMLLCGTEFKNHERFNLVLETLRNYYKGLSTNEDTGSFYRDMFNRIEEMCSLLKTAS